MAVGTDVDALAAAMVSAYPGAVSPEAAARREARDGRSYHITLASKAELADLASSQRSSFTAAAAALPAAGIARLGVGTASRGECKAWFVALLWPDLQAARGSVGLRRSSPHITLGFDGADVHECTKGALQLMPMDPLRPPPACDWTAIAAVARQVVETAGHGDEEGAESSCAVERLELEAAAAGSPLRADLMCSRCELQGYLRNIIRRTCGV